MLIFYSEVPQPFTLYFTLNPVQHGFVVFKINTEAHRQTERRFSFPRLSLSRLLHPYYEREVAEKAEVELVGANPHKQIHTHRHTHANTHTHAHMHQHIATCRLAVASPSHLLSLLK